jgi:amino acid transporter
VTVETAYTVYIASSASTDPAEERALGELRRAPAQRFCRIRNGPEGVSMSDTDQEVGPTESGRMATAQPVAASENLLRRGVISLADAIAQSVTFMAPAVSAAFISCLAAIKAGGATPLAFLLAMVGCLLIGGVVSGFAVSLPSAGSLYTYTVNGLGSFWGFVVGWTYACSGVVGGPAMLAGFAVFTSLVMGHLDAPGPLQKWSFWFAIGVAVYLLLSYFGIQFSTRTQLVFTAATMATLLLLAVIIVGKGGAHGNTVDAFNPGAAGVSWPLVFGGLAFGMLSFVGFETAAVLAEETRNPRRNIPVAVIGAVISVGIFYVFMTYATSIGYGVREATTAWPKSAGGLSALTDRYAPYLGDWVLLAAGLSSLFSGLAVHNMVARILYAMGREGALPGLVGRTHPVHRTPHLAIVLNLVLMVVVSGSLIGATSQPTRDAIGASPGALSSGFYVFTEGLTIAAPLVMLSFVLLSIAGIRFGLAGDGPDRRTARHVALSCGSLLASTLALFGSLYYSFAALVPGADIPGPYRAVPIIVAAVVAMASGAALTLRRRRRDAWDKMGVLFE